MDRDRSRDQETHGGGGGGGHRAYSMDWARIRRPGGR